MSRLVPDACQFQSRSMKIAGAKVDCGKPLRYIHATEGLRTLFVWSRHSQRFYGPCHLDRIGNALREQFMASFPDWPEAYRPYVPSEAEERLAMTRERQMRHALSDDRYTQMGGLKRLDGSGSGDIDLGRAR